MVAARIPLVSVIPFIVVVMMITLAFLVMTVKKKMRDSAFAAGVDRESVRNSGER